MTYPEFEPVSATAIADALDRPKMDRPTLDRLLDRLVENIAEGEFRPERIGEAGRHERDNLRITLASVLTDFLSVPPPKPVLVLDYRARLRLIDLIAAQMDFARGVPSDVAAKLLAENFEVTVK